MAHQDTNWLEALPLVLLGIRATFKEDISATASDLVYGETLRLPSELLKPPALQALDHSDLLHRLRSAF